MNKKFKKVVLTLFLFVTVLITGKVLADNLAKPTTEGKINVDKTAVVDKDDSRSVDVTLSASGNAFTESTTMDVVLIIDRSTSMNDKATSSDTKNKMESTKDAAISLANKLLGNNTAEKTVVNMGIVTFGDDVIDGYYHGENYYNRVYRTLTSESLTSSATTITTMINNIPNHVGNRDDDISESQGTNIHSGLEKANELLTDSTAKEKIVILLTDGKPTYFNYNGDVYGTGGDDSAVCIEGSGKNCTKKSPSEAAKEEATKLKTSTETVKGATIYTVGFGLGNDETTKKFLNDIATSTNHAYLANKTSDLESKFNDIVKSITIIAEDVVVKDIIPIGFELDEKAIKDAYGDEVVVTKNEDGTTTTTYKKIESTITNEDGTTTKIYSDEISITKNEDGTTTIDWKIGDLSVTKNETLTYPVTAKDDYYGGMYTNASAVLKGTTINNPAYPSGKAEEVFPMPIVPISMLTEDDSYTTKIDETLNIKVSAGILKNDSDIKMTDGEGTTVTNNIVIKSASCGDISDITVNNDGSFNYTPNTSCYTGENSKVTFDYEVKSTVTINGEPQVVTSNISTITINLTKDEATIENPTVTKVNNDGTTTTSITGPFNYTIKYEATIKDHIGNTTVTIVDELPYELDETKENDLADGTYNKENKTITWTETIENINSYENKDNEINIEKTITVFYKNVPTDVETIENKANVTTDIDNTPTTGSEETIVVRGKVLVEYVDNLGNTLEESISSEGLINTKFETNAKNTITKDNTEYVLVATKVNGTEVEKTNKYSGEYAETNTTVTYIYYKVTGDIDKDQTVITKEGPDKVTSTDEEFEYTITYNTKIDNYIGDATVTVIDTLPLPIDETKSDLAGGTYNKEEQTVTWIIPINDINTYETGTYPVNVEKTIKVVFEELDPTTRTLTNHVSAKVETSKSENEKETSEETKIEVKGTVIAHYVDINDNELLKDITTSDLVGNDYTTSSETIKGYELVETKGNPTGKYIDGTIEVTYVYYKVEGTISNDTIKKSGTDEVKNVTDTFEYKITYSAVISNYIGDATVTITDTLPLPIDETKAYDLDGGVYDKETLTITWTKTIENIDTNKNGSYPVEIEKNISLSYSELEATTRKITNTVVGNIKTKVTEETTEPSEKDTAVKVEGTVIAHYVDTEDNKLLEDNSQKGLVGNDYTTSSETIKDYELVETIGNSTGKYIDGTIEVTYVYYKVVGKIEDNTIIKTGTEEVKKVTDEFNYQIIYNTTIKDYIGDATVTITDTLPLPIDETKAYDLDGGVYDKENLTITWTKTIENIDTNKNGNYSVEIEKNISLSYSGLEATTREITNTVIGNIKTAKTEETTKPAEKDTAVKVEGTVIAHYVDTEDNKLLEDYSQKGLVGNDYTTSSETIKGYELVETKGNPTGKYIDGTIEVTYVYYKVEGKISNDTIKKSGTDEVEKVTDTFEYKINYSAVISNYIGDATVTITDTLPLPIDETKAYNLDGGVYDKENLTITWTKTIENIDTNKNGNYLVEIEKNISLNYSGLEATTREITNTVVGNIKTKVTEETTEPVEKDTAVKVEGTVITHYVDTEDNKLLEDYSQKGLVGNDYTTSSETIKDYELVETKGNPTGKYIDGTIEITYVYYKITGEITNETVEKTGNEKITTKDEKVEYTINYQTEINNYIGNATVTVIDYLPYEIDLSASNLDGGVYDKENLTITWTININNINTYENGVYEFKLTKNLLLKYEEIDLTSNKLTNKVSVDIKTDVTENKTEDKFDTNIDVKGFVRVNYIDDKGNKLLDSILLSGKIGDNYLTEEKVILDYILIQIEGQETGKYIDGITEVTYIYTELGKGGDVEILPPQTGVNENNNYFMISMFAALLVFIKKIFS